ncbi:MAG: hypothetical protein Kow0098_08800 [Ignavibacteriaceae bacterium]
MLLTFDIGNSAIKAAAFEGDEIKNIFRISDVFQIPEKFKLQNFDSAVISSVVPGKTEILTKLIREYSDISPFVVTYQSRLNLIIDYETPETLGTDRICACEGALYLVKRDYPDFFNNNSLLLVIDAGTATTTNLILYPGVFVGGTIAPGLKTMVQSLSEKTAELPEVKLDSYSGPIGKSSKDAISSGIFNSAFGQINKVLEAAKDQYRINDYMIFGTGGLIEFYVKYSEFEIKTVIGLVNYGLKEIYKLNS